MVGGSPPGASRGATTPGYDSAAILTWARPRLAQPWRRRDAFRRRPGQPPGTAASRKGRAKTASTADYYAMLGLRLGLIERQMSDALGTAGYFRSR